MNIKSVSVRNNETGDIGVLPEHVLDLAFYQDRFTVLDERTGCVDCGTAPVEEVEPEPKDLSEVDEDDDSEGEEEATWPLND